MRHHRQDQGHTGRIIKENIEYISLYLQPMNDNSLFTVATGGDYRVTFTYVPNVADGKQIKVGKTLHKNMDYELIFYHRWLF